MKYKDLSPEGRRQYHREYMREWCKNNPEKIKKSRKKHYQKNSEKYRKYRQEHKEEKKEYSRKWREDNKESRKKYRQEWEKRNLEKTRKYQIKSNRKIRATLRGTLNHRMEVSIRRALKGNKAGRHWETLVGYTLQDLIDRLSVNFQEGMSFENYGEWHIDHRKPQSLFHYETPEEQAFRDCWSLANLQPLWAIENILSKGHSKKY